MISLIFATLLLIYLVEQIEPVVHSGVPDQFLGLILLPLVEKAAEHLTAIDEAWDGVINVALYHCLGPSIQTALFNGPLVVLVGWFLGKPMDLNFEIFMIVLLVLSIVVVGNFLRDGESNWLEGALLVVSRSPKAITTQTRRWSFLSAKLTIMHNRSFTLSSQSRRGTTLIRMLQPPMALKSLPIRRILPSAPRCYGIFLRSLTCSEITRPNPIRNNT